MSSLIVIALSPLAREAGGRLETVLGLRPGGGVPFSWVVTPQDDPGNGCLAWLFHEPVSKIPPLGGRGDPLAEQRWALRNGAVDIGGRAYTVALQGTTRQNAIIQDVRVKIVARQRLRRGTQVGVGEGCGGGLAAQEFRVNVDRPDPKLVPVNGAVTWPYVLSARKLPEYLVLHAGLKDRTGAREYHFVYQIDWLQGSRHGTVTVPAPDGRLFALAPSTARAPVYGSRGGRWASR